VQLSSPQRGLAGLAPYEHLLAKTKLDMPSGVRPIIRSAFQRTLITTDAMDWSR
jgi:hypothetical protein